MALVTALCENGVLTFSLDGRVDSTNAESCGNDIQTLRGQYPHTAAVLDVEKLQYISSAGLRVILHLRKDEPTLTVINANSDVYDILDMTGFAEMMPVSKAYRHMSVDGCSVIGQGAKGIVYRYDPDTIVKVYRRADCLPDIQRERELARRAFVLGIPTAISYDIVKVGDSYGSVFELLNADSFSHLIMTDTANRAHWVSEYALLLKKIHSTEVRSEDMPDIRGRVGKWADIVCPYLTVSDAEKLRRLLTDLPERVTMLHIDYHTNNVMSQNGETLLIDMDTLSWGHPIVDLGIICSVYQLLNETNPRNCEDFLGMDIPACDYVWSHFLPVYLGTEDGGRIAEVERKARLVGSLRSARFAIVHGGSEAARQHHIDSLHGLLACVDTLDF